MPRAKAAVKAKPKAKAKKTTTARKSVAKKAAPKKAATKKVAAKKVATKKVATKKATTRKAPVKKAASNKKIVAISKKQTKLQIVKTIAEETGLSAADVKAVFECTQAVMERHMKQRGSGEFTVPELAVKVRRVRKKATKKRMGRNPFSGEEIVIAAKPARDVIRVTAMKALKEMIA